MQARRSRGFSDLTPAELCDPVRWTDALLMALAVGKVAECVCVNAGRECHLLFHEGEEPVLRVPVPALLGRGLKARLALLADLDLIGSQPQSGVITLAGPDSRRLQVTLEAGLIGPVHLRRLSSAPSLDLEHHPGEVRPGQRVGSYQLIEELGRGGMAVVFRARHVHLHKDFAVKILREDPACEAEHTLPMFLGEARAAARIDDPRIVGVTDFGRLPLSRRPYLVMELVRGRAIASIIDDGWIPSPVLALQIVACIADAMAAAHAAGVMHGDLSPANVYVDLDSAGYVRVLDFGSARIHGDEIDDGGMIAGTPCYMSPELAMGKPPTTATDIYSLGIILYELLSGDIPFDAEDVREVLLQHVKAPIPPIECFPPAIGGDINALIRRCLAKRPEHRFADMIEMRDACSALARYISSHDSNPGHQR